MLKQLNIQRPVIGALLIREIHAFQAGEPRSWLAYR
jgi:hypothetical protein